MKPTRCRRSDVLPKRLSSGRTRLNVWLIRRERSMSKNVNVEATLASTSTHSSLKFSRSTQPQHHLQHERRRYARPFRNSLFSLSSTTYRHHVSRSYNTQGLARKASITEWPQMGLHDLPLHLRRRRTPLIVRESIENAKSFYRLSRTLFARIMKASTMPLSIRCASISKNGSSPTARRTKGHQSMSSLVNHLLVMHDTFSRCTSTRNPLRVSHFNRGLD